MVGRSLIHTPDPESRSLGVRSVIEGAGEVISTERKHLEGDRKKERLNFITHYSLKFSNIVFGCQN